MVFHNIDPVYDNNSRILILGSFPSVKSRETGFYYGHPQNRFWKILSAIYIEELPVTIKEKKELLIRNNIALWDVIESCDINGSDDNSIDNVKPNNLNMILNNCHIERICLNGLKAYKLFNKYFNNIEIETVLLKSSSPANAAYRLDDLIDDWKNKIKGDE